MPCSLSESEGRTSGDIRQPGEIRLIHIRLWDVLKGLDDLVVFQDPGIDHKLAIPENKIACAALDMHAHLCSAVMAHVSNEAWS